MSKRGPSSELTDRNWDQDDEVEESGMFSVASSDVLQQRQIKKAVRKTVTKNEDKGSAFSGFTGFSFKPTTDTTAKSTAGSGFSFASNASTSNGGNSSGFGASKLTGSVFGNKSALDSSNSSKKTNSQYLQDLKSLNDSVLSWIKSHVDKNPFCILSPIFKDYEKHLSQLEKDYDKLGEKSTVNNELIHDTKPSQSIAGNNVLSSEAKSSMSIADVKPSATFQFGSSLMKTDTTNASLENKPLFSFAVGKPQLTDSNADTGSSQEEEYVPPKPESSDIKEEGAVMTKRCKLFYQKEGVWTEKGVGNLHLKPLEDSRVQLVIRADTTLGNVLLNILLAKVIPLSREGKNNVSLFCVPNPPINPKADTSQPVQMLIRVKSGEEADELLAKMEELRN